VNRLVRAELAKLRTTRTTPVLLATMAAFAALLTAAILTLAGHQGNPPLDANALRTFVGAPSRLLSGVVLLVGILAMAGELRHTTITPTFLVAPDRARVVVAKLAAVALAGLFFSVVAEAVTLAVAVPALAAKGVAVHVTGAVGRELAGVLVVAALSGMLGVAVAALVGNQLAAVVGAVLWVFVAESVLPVLFHDPGLSRWLPGAAAAALTEPGGQHLSMWAGGLVLAAYGLALAAVGTRLVVRRDVT